ncbi:hypothetical protein [Corynebacterium sp.]|uniref:hypothetical protein n=1 Tax=Corynebacterium sp. TaxID=1720 RepID=UPI0026DF655E|nr:hypothetical protein [Corynebacterium sp.]MDO5511997.1 hypothetical protein [Corynebacterium sp.]
MTDLQQLKDSAQARADHVARYGAEWATVCARQAGEQAWALRENLDVLTDLAWEARSQGLGAPRVIGNEQLVATGNRHQDAALAILALQGSRFDFDHRRMHQILSIIGPDLLAEGNLGEAFEQFARLAAGEVVPTDDIRAVADAGAAVKVQHLVLHGLWLSPHATYGSLLVEIGRRLIRQNPTDANAWMRRADGHRRLHDYQAALDAIDTAIYHLPADRLTIHDDFARQRLFITNEWQMHDMITTLGQDQQNHLRTTVSAYGEKLRTEYQSMVFRVMEILALFTALIGLLAATVGTAVAGSLSMWERIAVMSGASLFLIFFFVMVRVLSRPDRRTYVELPEVPHDAA